MEVIRAQVHVELYRRPSNTRTSYKAFRGRLSEISNRKNRNLILIFWRLYIMANDFTSNITRKVMKTFLNGFEAKRVISKNIDTQLFQGKFKGDSGDVIDVKRPTDYTTYRNATGDLTSSTSDSIITGKATATVQDYFTSWVEYDEADEAIKMDQLEQLLNPMSTRIATDFELDMAAYMMKNTNLLAGTVGTAADTWDDIAEAGAVMEASGVPMGANWCYAVNPFTQRKLASTNRSLGAGGVAGGEIKSSLDKATIADNFAGMRVLTATTLASYTTGTGADRAGTLTATPTPTYVTYKDTMQMTLAVTAFQANLVVAAGETITVATRNRLNLATRQPIIDETGATILFSGTVTETVTLGGSGEGSLVISGPAIFEATGAYNTVASAVTSGDVVTLGGAATTLIQPNLFWHKQAFTCASVPIKRLHSTDTFAETEDGLQFRVSKWSDGVKNEQKLRIDFRPAYGTLNPFFAGQGFGAP